MDEKEPDYRLLLSNITSGTKPFLTEEFNRYNIADLREKFQKVEAEIICLLKAYLLELLKLLFREDGFEIISKENGTFKTISGHFRLSVRPNDKKKHPLEIVACVRRFALDPLQSHTPPVTNVVPISGVGGVRWVRIELCSPPHGEKHLKYAETLVRTTFEEAYEWMKYAVVEQLSKLETPCAKELYAKLDAIFPPTGDDHNIERLSDHIWFSVFGDDWGVYLLTNQVMESIRTLLERTKMQLPGGAAINLAYLAGLVMPFKLSLSKDSINSGDCEKFLLPEAAQYATREPQVYRTESIMIGQDTTGMAEYMVCPIDRESPLKLVAAFPMSKKKDIKNALIEHRPDLAAIYKEHREEVHDHALRVKKAFPSLHPRNFWDFVRDLPQICRSLSKDLYSSFAFTLPPGYRR